ncbi:MAG: hypothetical protein HWE16_06930 [Gammaproteobacteria bacterium]|nr:hypothetical protein [Gammaproteobacteria bacterium]
MKILISSITFIFLLTGCDQLKVENQINDKTIESRELKAENASLTSEVKDLTEQVARLSVQYPDGAIIEETRKALTQKATELKQREERYLRQVEELDIRQKKLETMKSQFYLDTGTKLEEIGEARQIKKEYVNLREELDRANERANNWLIFYALMGVCFIGSIILMLYTSYKHSRNYQTLESVYKIASKQGLLN